MNFQPYDMSRLNSGRRKRNNFFCVSDFFISKKNGNDSVNRADSGGFCEGFVVETGRFDGSWISAFEN